MKQVQWFDSRFYKVLLPTGTDFFPSVTTKLNASPKPFLAKWRGDVGNEEADRVMNEARNRGTIIHNACEQLVKGAVIVLADGADKKEVMELEKYRRVVRVYEQEHYWQVMKFRALLEVLRPTEAQTEQTIYSVANRYAGTMDYIWYLTAGTYLVDGSKPVVLERDGYYIADIKTGNSISDDAYMQLAAYKYAVEEMSSIKIEGVFVVHTNAATKKGIEGLACKYRTLAELEVDFKNFLAVSAVWDINPTATAPKVFDMPVMMQWRPSLSEGAIRSTNVAEMLDGSKMVEVTPDRPMAAIEDAVIIPQTSTPEPELAPAAPAAKEPDAPPAESARRAAKATTEKLPNSLDKTRSKATVSRDDIGLPPF